MSHIETNCVEATRQTFLASKLESRRCLRYTKRQPKAQTGIRPARGVYIPGSTRQENTKKSTNRQSTSMKLKTITLTCHILARPAPRALPP